MDVAIVAAKSFDLTETCWLTKAAAHYDYSQIVDDAEFIEDIQRITYIKRLFRRYLKNEELNERIILNHLITMNNMFDTAFLVDMLFFKCEAVFHPVLKTFLLYMGLMRPEDRSDIPVDPGIASVLRSI